MIGQYFDKNYPDNDTNKDTCCDNCQKTICEIVRPSTVYKGVNEDNMIDITEDSRLLLAVLRDFKFNLYDSKCILLGRVIKHEKPYRLDFFGAGRHKPDEYWTIIYEKLLVRRFLEPPTTLTNAGLKFLKYKRRSLYKEFDGRMKKFLDKKDIHITIENGEIKITPKKKISYEDVNEEIKKALILRPQKRSNNGDLFEFEVSTKPVLKKSPKKLQVEETVDQPPPPKKSWRDTFASLMARKDNENIFKPIEAPKAIIQPKSFENALHQPGCSHWSTTEEIASCNDSSNSFSSNKDQEEEELDDKYVENMQQLRQLTSKQVTVPLDDLLDYIEQKNTSDKNAEQLAISHNELYEFQKTQKNMSDEM